MDLKLLDSRETEKIDKSFLFKNESADFVARALSDPLCELAEFGKGKIIYDAREYRNSIGYILSGTVQVNKTMAEGHRYIMNTLVPGSCFGAAAIFCDSPEYVTILSASSSCRIVFFAQPLMERLIAESPSVAVSYISFLAGRIRFLNNKIQGLLSESAGQALANFLIGSCFDDNGELVFRLDSSISSLAEKLNIGRSSLYRSFEALENCGFISREGKEIKILDPQGLAKYTGEY